MSDTVLERLPQEATAPPSPTNPPRRSVAWKIAAALLAGIPAVITFGVLGGVAYWGYQHDWTLPKYSALNGEATKGKEDWCAEHGVPESVCVECDTDLMHKPEPVGWCKQFGVHECPLCHPEVAQTATPPVPAKADFARAERAVAFTDRPENNRKCQMHRRRIQFVSKEAADKVGIEVEPVWTAPVTESVAGNGEAGYDQTRIARLSARLPGSVWKVFKQQGDPVKAGDLLALIDAADVGKAKAELLQAFASLQLKTQSFASITSSGGAVAEARVREAEIRLDAARQSLVNLGLPLGGDLQKLTPAQLEANVRFLGLSAELVKSLDANRASTNLLPLVAPMEGVIVSRDVVAGEVVDSTKLLFTVADARRMWVTLDLRLEDAKLVALGQEVRFRPDGGTEASGKITWVSTEADPKTRTVKLRASVENPAGRLRANTFGAGQVVLREEKEAVVVPTEAVQWEGCCHVVFVRDKDYLKDGSPKVFHVRTVRVGAKDGKNTEIIAGVVPGELVVTKGSTALRAELLKGNLGEGCTCGK
ncbi:MAG: efflux RND transporter periplasmic adaptor subunit [Planctomycetes bacterium]|nr:efflux RND transporter periplasmic adaptor subunit [Planctomycetota bacterium]